MTLRAGTKEGDTSSLPFGQKGPAPILGATAVDAPSDGSWELVSQGPHTENMTMTLLLGLETG